jgi:hypothetical protein
MDDDYKIIESPLSRQITEDGVAIHVQIYRGEQDAGWILEVVDDSGGSTVWQEPLKTEADALSEVLRTIETRASEPSRKIQKTVLNNLRRSYGQETGFRHVQRCSLDRK